MSGAQDRGGVDYGRVAHALGGGLGGALFILGPLHGLQLGHAGVGQLAWAGEERLHIMLDGRLLQGGNGESVNPVLSMATNRIGTS